MKKILLDTSAYIKFLAGDENVYNVLKQADIVYFSVIVLGELWTGYKSGAKEKNNREVLRLFCQRPTVQKCFISEETAEIYSEIKFNLKKNGKPIPINDVWLAAQAYETGSLLVTYDKHFYNIPGLRVWIK